MFTDRIPYSSIALAAAVAALAFFAGTFLSSTMRAGAEAPEGVGLLWPNPPSLNEFSLVNDENQRFDRDQLMGKWTLLFFGFTQCPDVCPSSLQTLATVNQRLAADPVFAQSGQLVFVSIDPERDTLDVLEQYVEYFDKDIIGVTGSIDALKNLTTHIGVLFAKIAGPTPETYTMDHSASILLIDPQARLLGIFGMPHSAPDISQKVERIIAFYQSQSANS